MDVRRRDTMDESAIVAQIASPCFTLAICCVRANDVEESINGAMFQGFMR